MMGARHLTVITKLVWPNLPAVILGWLCRLRNQVQPVGRGRGTEKKSGTSRVEVCLDSPGHTEVSPLEMC